jgi:hypothetical protein
MCQKAPKQHEQEFCKDEESRLKRLCITGSVLAMVTTPVINFPFQVCGTIRCLRGYLSGTAGRLTLGKGFGTRVYSSRVLLG